MTATHLNFLAAEEHVKQLHREAFQGRLAAQARAVRQPRSIRARAIAAIVALATIMIPGTAANAYPTTGPRATPADGVTSTPLEQVKMITRATQLTSHRHFDQSTIDVRRASATAPLSLERLLRAPTIHVVTRLTKEISAVPPTAVAVHSRTVGPLARAASIACGQYLTWHLTATYYAGPVPFVSLSSIDYTKWCSGKVYAQSYSVHCAPVYYGLLDYYCQGGQTSSVIGNGTGEVNPWYNQPIGMVAVDEDDGEVGSGTVYCRNYMWANGNRNDWCSFTPSTAIG